jgi:5-methylcytosine-specific restriction endonuclease McrA
MWYNPGCLDDQNTGALSFQKLPTPANEFTGKAPSMCWTYVLAGRLGNGSAHGGRFDMVTKIHRKLYPEDKLRILDRDGWICAYCGSEASVVDHVVPWDWSHCDDEDNLVASCELCNAIAGDLIFSSFIEKSSYIIETRKRRRHRPNGRSFIHRCLYCGVVFVPLRKGATNLICADCEKAQDSEDFIFYKKGKLYARR